jgi:serine/threonine protein kinase/tetratricopeptide (TPR) repeat protein
VLLQPGAVVANRFEIEHLAGKGGMGSVYRARDRQTGGIVALKVVHEEAPTDHHERLVREARLLAELQHPSIVRYLAFGATDKGWPYLAMEWLDGEDLAMHLRGDGLDANDAVALATRVAEALGVAHERGIVHRDVKPSNLFLVGGDPARVKVLDFGVARIQLADDGVTRTGAAVGTPRYMSPEQARGSRDVDVRADVFALGCVLFECLTGRPAFSGANQGAVLAKILLEDAPRLSSVRDDLPPALDELLARMLAKQRDDRPRDGRAVAEELAAIGALGETARRSTGGRDGAVTTGEQRLVCVVFAETALEVSPWYSEKTPSTPSTGLDWPAQPVLPDLNTPTQTIDPRRPAQPTQQLVRKLESIVAEHHARAEVMKDGSVVVTLSGRGAATDQAASAARCALALRKVFPNTAMALAIGRSAVTDRTPYGELIDRATAVLSRPPPEAVRQGMFPIYVDDTSAPLLDLRFSIEGDTHGLFLSRERDVAVAARTLLGKPTECVGRERELGMLLATFEECVSEPMAHIVLVTAAAGIGKSRVRFELMQRLAGRPFELLLGRGDPISAGTPFAMLAQALRRTAGVVDDEPASVRYRKLRARVMRHVPPHEAEQVTEFLAELLGVAPPGEGSVQLRAARQDPQLMADQMLRACQGFLAAECAANPVVIVFEDMQWSDRATVQFIDGIVRQLEERPLFVLALARPEVDQVFPRLWADRRVERLQLHELTRRASEKLVRDMLGNNVDNALVAKLIERAAGNAFYLEELIRSVAEGHKDRLPETVVAMVQARIEALEVEARHVLRAASIFGQVFWRGGVEALLDGGTTQVDDWLDELTRRELITARKESRFSGEVEYTFRHAIVREAAYAMVTERDRVVGHRLAGGWLEARVTEGADVEAVALAEHFRRGGEPLRSITWYRRAAQQALEGDDLAGAIECAERAIGCTESADASSSYHDRELVGALRQLQAGAHVWRGEYALATERGNEALSLLSPSSVPWLVAAAAVADACSRRLEHARVLELCRTLAATDVTPPLYHAYAHAVATTMTALLWHGDAALIEQLFGKLAAIEAAGVDPATAAWIYYAQAWRALHDGDMVGALEFDQKVEHCFTEVGDLRQACRQHASVGYGQLMLGANAEAEKSLRESIAIATKIGLHQVTAVAQQNLGVALVRLGKIDEARDAERAALAACEAQQNFRHVASARNYLAEIELAAGNAGAAIDYARAAIADDSERPGFHCVYRARIASAHLLAGDTVAALDEATQAMQLMDAHGRPEEGEMIVRLAYARALHASGDIAHARTVIADTVARITAIAARIGDPTLRQSFLDAVPEHAVALALEKAWRPETAS